MARTTDNTREGRAFVAWLAATVRRLHHGNRDEIVTLEAATARLYPERRRAAWKADGLHWPRWESMRIVYERTKGQAFVFEPAPELLARAGVEDVGPLYLWSQLWGFAGSPEMDKNDEAKERPSWRPSRYGYGLAFWETVCDGRGPLPARAWVTRLRNHQRKPARPSKLAAIPVATKGRAKTKSAA